MSLVTPDLGLLFWMTLIFGLLFILLAKFGFPVITSMVEKRSERIAKSIEEAKEVEKRMVELKSLSEKILDDARSSQASMLREAARSRDEIIAQARGEAQKEASRMIEEARVQIAAEKENAMRDVRSQIAVLSVGIAEKVLRQALSREDTDEQFIGRMIDEASRLPELGNDGRDARERES